MIKYLKWVSFLLLIICIFIIIYLYVSGFESYEKDDSLNVNDKLIEQISGVYWNRVGITIYDGDKLLVNNENLVEKDYILFDSDYMQYCNFNDNNCEKCNYIYKDATIEFFEGCIFTPGVYDVRFEDERLVLSLKDSGNTFIYYYEIPKG